MNDTLDNELKDIEAQLANLTPSQMPDGMLSRLEQAMTSWETHQPVEDKIVPFNPPTPLPAKRKSNLHLWSSAAAIALMASVATVFMTGNSSKTPVVAQSTELSSVAPISKSAAPELSRNITHASNEGITYAGIDESPFKVLRVEYTENVITQDKEGKPIVTKKPCVEHVLIPVPVH